MPLYSGNTILKCPGIPMRPERERERERERESESERERELY
jgi:hypothetical protein